MLAHSHHMQLADLQAQNNIASPMKDVNQVVDNTLDSLNKARTARPLPEQAVKVTIRSYSWSATLPCAPVL